VKDLNGQTPLDRAKIKNNNEVVNLMIERETGTTEINPKTIFIEGG